MFLAGISFSSVKFFISVPRSGFPWQVEGGVGPLWMPPPRKSWTLSFYRTNPRSIKPFKFCIYCICINLSPSKRWHKIPEHNKPCTAVINLNIANTKKFFPQALMEAKKNDVFQKKMQG